MQRGEQAVRYHDSDEAGPAGRGAFLDGRLGGVAKSSRMTSARRFLRSPAAVHAPPADRDREVP